MFVGRNEVETFVVATQIFSDVYLFKKIINGKQKLLLWMYYKVVKVVINSVSYALPIDTFCVLLVLNNCIFNCFCCNNPCDNNPESQH